MPELPDITIYLESLQSRIAGQPLERIRIVSPFLLRSVDPATLEAEGKKVLDLRCIGIQIAWELEDECNYCPRCQTDGKILADRSLSRLLKDDWPRTIEELEANPGLNNRFAN
jgi:hypothetical protein